ncbi:hypothetical protein T310_6305, partial [Rasamsonia emersonii CBS 393.64]
PATVSTLTIQVCVNVGEFDLAVRSATIHDNNMSGIIRYEKVWLIKSPPSCSPLLFLSLVRSVIRQYKRLPTLTASFSRHLSKRFPDASLRL